MLRQHADRPAQPPRARRPGRRRRLNRTASTAGRARGVADRRPRSRRARRGGRRARRDRKPRREFLRRRRRAGVLARRRRACRRRRLQGDQHRRQHDRPSHRAPRATSASPPRGSTISSICRRRGLSALLIVLAAAISKNASASAAWRAVRRDARRHRSPNAGWPEAAMAGALGLALAGPRVYGGDRWSTMPTMGDGRRDATATRHPRRAHALPARRRDPDRAGRRAGARCHRARLSSRSRSMKAARCLARPVERGLDQLVIGDRRRTGAQARSHAARWRSSANSPWI